MKSKIYLDEIVENKDQYRSANKQYYPVTIELEDGTELKALFTYHQLATAIRRADRNKEDFKEEGFFEKLFHL